MKRASVFCALLAGLTASFIGCNSGSNAPNSGPTKLKVAYLGLTCEAPMFVAQEKGFYEEEGLDVELVKTDWDGLREGLGLGRFDANYTLHHVPAQADRAGARREDHRRRPHGLPAGPGRRQVGHQDGRRTSRARRSASRRTWAARRYLFCQPRAGRPRHRSAAREEGRDLGAVRPGRAGPGGGERPGRRGRDVRSDRHDPAWARGLVQHHRRPGGGRTVPRRILLRCRSSAASWPREPGGGGQGDAGVAQGGQVGRDENPTPRPSSPSRRSTSRPRRRSTPRRSPSSATSPASRNAGTASTQWPRR